MNVNPSTLEITATVIFALAVIHTFIASKFQQMAHHYPTGSIMENLFHFLGEVEAVFGMWAAVFLVSYAFIDPDGWRTYKMLEDGSYFLNADGAHVVAGGALKYLMSVNFTEPAFVFVIMAIAGSRPIIVMAEKMIIAFTKVIFLPKKYERATFYISALILGPLLGSFITEPAAMTVTGLIMLDYFFSGKMSNKFKYATLGLLFVNVSIGGTLTHFAAPPVLMVAGKWGWGFGHIIGYFGWKSALAVVINTNLIAWYFKDELQGELEIKAKHDNWMEPTWWIILVSLLFMGAVVYSAHDMVAFMGLFLFYLGFAKVTEEYQDKPKIVEALMVGFFLAGLVTLGKMQAWWIQPLLERLGDMTLFIGSTFLTAITDNAALTYLGSQSKTITETQKYFLVAGAVTGGGLTVIANAPNPAGFGILKASFGKDGIKPLGLFIGSLVPTFIAFMCLWLLPPFAKNPEKKAAVDKPLVQKTSFYNPSSNR